jgi:membrane-bound lytic murein transglycosylase B
MRPAMLYWWGASQGDEGEPSFLSARHRGGQKKKVPPVFFDAYHPKESLMSRFLTQAILLITALVFLTHSNAWATTPDTLTPDQGLEHFTTLKKRLVSEGFDANLIEQIYASPEIFFDNEGTGLFFVHNEGILDYERFANKTAIHRAQKYIDQHRGHFEAIEKQFGVDKTVITAIILVETGLGTYLGKRRVINTLSTMAAISDEAARNHLWESLSDEKRLPREQFEKKADRKSAWAFKELQAFIRYTQKENLNPGSINGSYAGAMGIAQFMPSNILLLAMDGNNDGVIDMFDHEDAIASIANYLKHYGWHETINKEKAHKVLYAYNHSSYYVNILLKISGLLKGTNG